MQNRQGLTSVYAYSDGLNGKPNAWGLLGYCLRNEPQERVSNNMDNFLFLVQLGITLHSERSPTLVIMAPVALVIMALVALVSLFAMEVTCRHCPR